MGKILETFLDILTTFDTAFLISKIYAKVLKRNLKSKNIFINLAYKPESKDRVEVFFGKSYFQVDSGYE